MAGYGTGYPIWFHCRRARSVYYGDRSSVGEEVTAPTMNDGRTW